jgi:hypothetical protein
MEQTKFTIEEYQKLKETAEGIKDYLPENLLPYIWDNYRIISGNIEEPRPCSCASAAGHWKKAVDTIKNYIREVDTK